MLDKQHRRRIFEQQLLDLQARNHINEVQRFVPEEKVRFFAETFGNQDFFLLASAEIRHVFVKLNPREIKLTQASFEDRFIDSVFSGKVGQTAAEMGGSCGTYDILS